MRKNSIKILVILIFGITGISCQKNGKTSSNGQINNSSDTLKDSLTAPREGKDDNPTGDKNNEENKSKDGSTVVLDTLSVLQFNIWQAGSHVPNGRQRIADVIARFRPDIVTISENTNDFMPKIKNTLADMGITYYTFTSNNSGILSRYKIVQSDDINIAMAKAIVRIKGTELAVYSLHLDFVHYAEYLPRGYDGGGGRKLSNGPITAEQMVLAEEEKSARPQQVNNFLDAAQNDISKGRKIILGGDFNQASHLDWGVAVKDLWEHNGAVIHWQGSVKLYNNGFIDSYRELHPDVINYPGFTWPVNDPWINTDERDRIDFIYYYDDDSFKPLYSYLVGPQKIYINKTTRIPSDSKDVILLPINTWPSDHRAVLSTFTVDH